MTLSNGDGRGAAAAPREVESPTKCMPVRPPRPPPGCAKFRGLTHDPRGTCINVISELAAVGWSQADTRPAWPTA